jgi:uncharacterized protein
MLSMKNANIIQTIVETLKLEKHCEGGYFAETYRPQLQKPTDKRGLMTSIYYLLTQESKLSYFATNKSDLMLYHHLGAPVKVVSLDNGKWVERILGSNIAEGEMPQLLCPGGICKAYDLMNGNFALIGEAVSPGFIYDDMEMPNQSTLTKQYPDLADKIGVYTLTS